MILRFACLSATAHVIALVALHQPAPPWSMPAPELRINFAVNASGVALPHRTRAAVPVHASTRTSPSSAVTEPSGAATESGTTDGLESEPPSQRANHLRSALYAELKHYFVYPALARRHGWEGRVEVSLWLDRDGRLRDLRLVRSSGYAILDSNAVETLRRMGALPYAAAGFVEHPQELALLIVYQLLDG